MTPQASWWRMKAPVQSGPGAGLGGVMVTMATPLGSFSAAPSRGKRFLFVQCLLQPFPALRGQGERRPGEGQGSRGPQPWLGQSRAGLPFGAVLAPHPWTSQTGPESLLSTVLGELWLTAPSPPESIVKEPLCSQLNF